MTVTSQPTRLDKFLGLFTDVHAGEGVLALLLASNVFLILMAYYILKVVREALILGEGSAELKTYMSAGQVIVLAFAVPAYGWLVSGMSRMRLINIVTAFFVACLLLFYVLAQFGVSLAVVYFIWIGIFNLMIVAQFWSFANDIYSKTEGERLFAIVGFGASLGAVVGARAASRLIGPFGVNQLMLVGAAVLVAQVLLSNHIDARDRARRAGRPDLAANRSTTPKTKGPATNAFALVFRTRYLLLMALMLLVFNWVNTTGEYILSSIVKETAEHMVAAGQTGGQSEGQVIGRFYSIYFTATNILGLLLQLFVVSRVVKRFGVPWALMVLPAIAFGAYNIIVFYPVLMAVLAAKVAENSTDYSLNNTVRNMLFLPCTYEEKFSAKQAIDSFFVRMGDVMSAGLVFVGTTMLSLHPRGFAAINALLVVVLLVLAWRVGLSYQQLTDARAHADVASATPAPAAVRT
jgi:ATP:ADP antiporter, AAA family